MMEVDVAGEAVPSGVSEEAVAGPSSGEGEAQSGGAGAGAGLVITAAPLSTVTSVSTVALHPLVIMNVAEHWTRLKAQQDGSTHDIKVIGALIGKQKGRNLEVANSFELVFDLVDADIIIDMDYYKKKEEQFKQVFPDLDFLGWYTTGSTPNESDIKVHKQMCVINESPVFLKMSPTSSSHDDGLPVTMYESVIDIVDGKATMLFVEVTFALATEEAERIGVDHVARLSASTGGERSAVSEHLSAQCSAVKMLYSRLQLVLSYVRDVAEGKVARNHDILRDIASLLNRMPVLDTDKFKYELHNQCNDVVLHTYLGMITKSCNNINQFISKFNLLYDRQGVGRRVRGMVY